MSAVEQTWPMDPTGAAVEFLCHDGRAARLAAQHQARPDGYCTGHASTLARWPCTSARLAALAAEEARRRCDAPTVPLRAHRRSRDTDTSGAA